jgi:hemerythrin HHE cation binding domain-containing protein
VPNETVMAWIRARVDADAPMRKAAEQRTAGPAEPGGEGSPDVLMVLTRDHNQVRTLIQQLTALPGHQASDADDLSRRRSLVQAITTELSLHEAAEEELFWPAVRKALPDGDTWADRAQAQEAESKATLSALTGLEPDYGGFDSLAQQLTAQVRKHVAYEAQVFGLMREAVSQNEREKLGKRLLEARKKDTSRPRTRAANKLSA